MTQSLTFLIPSSYSQDGPQKERACCKKRENEKQRGKEETNTTFDLVLRQFGIDTKEFPASSISHFARFPCGVKQ